MELGFATCDNGSVMIPAHQMSRIINLDETCLTLDENKGGQGGPPSEILYNPNLPSIGKSAVKSSLTTTMITGSSAAGEPLHPNFQFSTKAKTLKREKLHSDLIVFMPQIQFYL